MTNQKTKKGAQIEYIVWLQNNILNATKELNYYRQRNRINGQEELLYEDTYDDSDWTGLFCAQTNVLILENCLFEFKTIFSIK